MKRLAVAAVAALALLLGGRAAWTRYLASPVGPADLEAIVEVPKGMGFGRLPGHLAAYGVVSHPEALRLYLRLAPPTATLKAGEYALTGAMTPAALLERVTSGRVVLRPFTVPEGLTVAEIAALVEAKGLAPASAVLRLARDPGFIGSLAIDAESLEGYLFPETYHFAKGAEAEDILRAMVGRFLAVYDDAFVRRAEALGLSQREAVTLASIIEKETGVASERPRISAVFHNRLKKNMRLQSDPTVIYGLPDFDGNLRRENLRTPTAYNTYVIAGLPPGPIANPGEESLRAALWPAEDRALYFVSKGDGSHVFSESLDAHNRAVSRYQRGGG